MSLPESHIVDAHKLDGDGFAKLYEIQLSAPGGTLYLSNGPTVSWNGREWEGIGIQITEVKASANDDINRPKLMVRNPNGIYSSLADQGVFDNAMVLRYDVKREHLEAGTVIYRRQRWRISKIERVNRQGIQAELRSLLDGQFFVIPGKTYNPPEFPQVSLG